MGCGSVLDETAPAVTASPTMTAVADAPTWTLVPASATVTATRASTDTPTATYSPTATPTNPPSPTPVGLAGSVRDGKSGEPLVGAQVSWGDMATLTDDDGRFAFARTAPGAPLELAAAGYQAQTLVVDDAYHLDIPLVPRRLRIVAFDRLSYEPIAGVQIISVDGAHELAWQTDDEGEVVADRLDPTIAFQLDHEHYQAQQVLYEGQHQIMVPMEPHLLEGNVIDRLHGQTVPGARITVQEPNQVAQQVVADALGSFVLRGQPQAGWWSVAADGYLTLTRTITMPLSSPIMVALEPFVVKGVYVPYGALYLPERLRSIIDLVERTELNAIVVDVKSDRGRIAHHSEVGIALEGNAWHPDLVELDDLIRECNEKGIYAIARMVTFKDPVFSLTRPEYAITQEDGSLYVDLEGLTWADPFRQESRDYNIALAKEIATIGFDEIQFDYLRFPSDGKLSDIVYPVTSTVESRCAAMETFMSQAHDALKPMGVMISADLFGLTGWVKPERDMGIGQRVIDIAPYVDYISPMLYPDTFRGIDLGLGDPVEVPYELILQSCQRFQAKTDTKLRPWLSHYWGDVDYYLAQKRAANDAQTYGWIFWNAAGKYTEPDLFELESSDS